jgi:hypothetical protein
MNIKEEFNNVSPAWYYGIIIVFSAIFLFSIYFILDNSYNRIETVKTIDDSLSIPDFSHVSGFYKDDIEVELQHPDENANIYYTIDGSIPNIDDNLYTAPLKIKDIYKRSPNIEDIPTSPIWKMPSSNIHEGIVIRAAVHIPEKGMSKVATRHYFISPQGEIPYNIPIVLLATDNDNLFDRKKGIYIMGEKYYEKRLFKDRLLHGYQWYEFPANYQQRGTKWKKDGFFEYIDLKGKKSFKSDVQLKIFGGITRAFPQKSLSISFAHTTQGFPFFKNSSIQTYQSLILRSSGQDWRNALLRDAYFHKVIKDMHLETMDYQPVVLFINGKFWGLHNVREHWSLENIALKNNCKPEDITFLEYNWDEFIFKDIDEPTNENNETKSNFKELVDFVIENNFSEAHNYEILQEKIDLDNFVDYMIAQNYCGNIDWPNVNWKMYKINKDGEQGKWRVILHDVDVSLGNNWDQNLREANTYLFNMFDHKFQNQTFITLLFRRLLENKTFTKLFIERYNHHLSTTFEQNRMLSILDPLQKTIQPYITAHIDRWGFPESLNQWKHEVDVIRKFIRLRPDIVKMQLKEFAKNPTYYNEKYPEKPFTYKIM